MLMQDLLNQYSLTEVSEYFEMISDSYQNGQKKQAKEQFFAMDKDHQKAFMDDLREYPIGDNYHFFVDALLDR